jgi:hypothetical protein
MAATAAVLIFHKKCLDAFTSDSSFNLKEIHYWLDWVSERCYTCYYLFFIFSYWWHNSLFCGKSGGLGVVGAQRLSITS